MKTGLISAAWVGFKPVFLLLLSTRYIGFKVLRDIADVAVADALLVLGVCLFDKVGGLEEADYRSCYCLAGVEHSALCVRGT